MPSEPMTPERIEQIKARVEKATKGPWAVHGVDGTCVTSAEYDICSTCSEAEAEREDGYNVQYERMEADAGFIAHARRDVPDLVAEVERLRGWVDAIRDNSALMNNWLAAKAENARLREALVPLLQKTGDGIADMFEQMLKGRWRDYDGHDVKLNVQMLNLQAVLLSIGRFREMYLDYEPFDLDRTALTGATNDQQEDKP